MDTVSSRFDEIRPLNNNEVKATIEELLNTPKFEMAVKTAMPTIDWDSFCIKMRSLRTKREFKTQMSALALKSIAANTASLLDYSREERIDRHAAYTFITNHRDIVLDAAFLNYVLHQAGAEMTQVAIGDNLLIEPWIEKLVRLNNSFIVKRGVSIRQMLEVSKTLSAYIHYAIKELNESVWIAQREGRAKDSNDFTQEALLKMLVMGGEEATILDNLIELNIEPMAISYEFDPCDFLKAKEYQQKRDNKEHKESPADDLVNMQTGIVGFKGHIHFCFGHPINEQLKQLDPSMEKAELYRTVAAIIDKEIHQNYMFFPINYIAYQRTFGDDRFADKYNEADIAAVDKYFEGQLAKIQLPNKDSEYLLSKMYEMYANPVKNYLIATNQH